MVKIKASPFHSRSGSEENAHEEHASNKAVKRFQAATNWEDRLRRISVRLRKFAQPSNGVERF